MNALNEIHAFRALGDRLGTAGQPTAEQFPAIREAGFEIVVNLALPISERAIPDEGRIVTDLGMAYVHIPVDFETPSAAAFETFCRVMDAFHDRRVFVHCVANLRVSTFLFLYRVLCQRIAYVKAERDMLAVWTPEEAWARFIQDQLHSH